MEEMKFFTGALRAGISYRLASMGFDTRDVTLRLPLQAVWTAVEELDRQFTRMLEEEGMADKSTTDECIIEQPFPYRDYCTISVDYGTAGKYTTVLQLRNSVRELVSVSPDGSVTIEPDITLKEAVVAIEYLATCLWRLKS